MSENKQGEELKFAIRGKGLSMEKAAAALKISRTTLYSYFDMAELPLDVVQNVKLNLGIFIDTPQQDAQINRRNGAPVRNAHELGLPVDIHTSKAGISYVELSEGAYLMYAPHVTVRAQAGFKEGGFGDPVFVESLPKYPMIVRTVHKGSYFVFDITGDSMDDGSLNSIPDKSKVLAREIKLDLWRSRFHYNEFPYFIIVHKEHGVLCKEIIKHDVERGIITCHSLNPNKEMYQDFEVSLDDCLMICNVVKKELDARGY